MVEARAEHIMVYAVNKSSGRQSTPRALIRRGSLLMARATMPADH